MTAPDRTFAYPSVGQPQGSELTALCPVVIGATGGSGTRVVARIVRRAGLFIGLGLFVSEDPPAFGKFSDRWINTFMSFAGTRLPQRVERAMAAELTWLVRRHLASFMPSPERRWSRLAAHPVLARLRSRSPGVPLAVSRLWGWKDPRSIFLLPFFHAQLPRMKFLHVVRDGRDMALSSNQNQLNKHGRCLLSRAERALPRPVRAARLWARINVMAAEYGEHVLGDNYMRVRFEDLCADPVRHIERILRFAGLEANPESLVEEVQPPASLGRWRLADELAVAELTRLTAPALRRFGWP